MNNLYNTVLARLLFVFILFAATVSTNAQVSNYFASVNVLEAKETKPMVIVGELYQSGNVARVLLFYKPFGASEYVEIEMNQSGTRLETVIPADQVSPPFIEYYLVAQTVNSKSEAFPVGAPENANPFQVSILPVSEKDQQILILTLS